MNSKDTPQYSSNRSLLHSINEPNNMDLGNILDLKYSEKINHIVENLNETQPRAERDDAWRFTNYNFHFTNDVAVNQILGRMIFLFDFVF